MYTNIENYLFQISVYNSDLENEILYSILEVLTEDKMLTAKSLNTLF